MNKLTNEYILSCIHHERVVTLGQKTTAVTITLKNGFEITATSACVNPEDYDMVIGAEIARKRAIDKIWELEGYLKQVNDHCAKVIDAELNKCTIDKIEPDPMEEECDCAVTR